MRGYNIDKYINYKFNKLTLIENLNKIDKNNSKLALFKCDCGNIKEMVFTQVFNNHIKSCGCEQGKLSDIEKNKQYNSLVKYFKNENSNIGKTGKKGITKIGNKYRVRMYQNGKSVHLGYFDDLETAIKVRQTAAEKYYDDKESN